MRLALKVLTALSLLVFASACRDEKPRPVPLFNKGHFVKAKLDGQRGMIIDVHCWPGAGGCRYDVRFPARTADIPSHMFGSGGAIQNKTYALHYMREFELEIDTARGQR